ncbi:MAG: hypothetical protein AAGA77_10070 [Bacteroidota bacterium]
MNYDDDITVTDVPPRHFIAVTASAYNPDTKLRDIRVEIMPVESETTSTQTVNSGLFVRQDGSTGVKATVYQDDKELASNTQDY